MTALILNLTYFVFEVDKWVKPKHGTAADIRIRLSNGREQALLRAVVRDLRLHRRHQLVRVPHQSPQPGLLSTSGGDQKQHFSFSCSSVGARELSSPCYSAGTK